MGRSSSPFAPRQASPGRLRRSTPRTPRSGEPGDQRKTPRLAKPFVALPRSPRVEWDDEADGSDYPIPTWALQPLHNPEWSDDLKSCLLYTSDAADEEDSGDLGGCRLIKKKTKEKTR
eukprot:TRINITY_DN15126_c0_g1_i1.p2 TRINITY_DN15126_c0_g1~~TRINITY_DN15126_c0_g1_i1.p2  ORF type:complete len:118 (-),score=12.37 TRINITY_DN15126_c0_g1_i1:45-398(-)